MNIGAVELDTLVLLYIFENLLSFWAVINLPERPIILYHHWYIPVNPVPVIVKGLVNP